MRCKDLSHHWKQSMAPCSMPVKRYDLQPVDCGYPHWFDSMKRSWNVLSRVEARASRYGGPAVAQLEANPSPWLCWSKRTAGQVQLFATSDVTGAAKVRLQAITNCLWDSSSRFFIVCIWSHFSNEMLPQSTGGFSHWVFLLCMRQAAQGYIYLWQETWPETL